MALTGGNPMLNKAARLYAPSFSIVAVESSFGLANSLGCGANPR